MSASLPANAIEVSGLLKTYAGTKKAGPKTALKGIDPDKFSNLWGETQISLGNALRVLSFWDKGTKDLEDSVAANREAL